MLDARLPGTGSDVAAVATLGALWIVLVYIVSLCAKKKKNDTAAANDEFDGLDGFDASPSRPVSQLLTQMVSCGSCRSLLVLP